jgi:hypothetical protein
MSNLSRCRSEGRRAAKSIRNNYGGYNPVSRKPKKLPTLLEHALKDMDMMILMDVQDIIPQYSNSSSTVSNNIFPNQKIRCDKVCLIYSPRRKLYYYLAVNDNGTCYVLFKGKELKDLPNATSSRIDFDDINPNFVINENANRLMNCVIDEIIDITSNPIHVYKTSELFRR